MQYHDSVATIEDEGRRLLGFATPQPDRIVPQYPSWTLLDLVVHTAGVHGRTAAIVRTRAQDRLPLPERPPDLDALEWYTRNLAEMVDALGSTDPSTPVWSMRADHSVGFWVRRMTIETGVHRWDAQGATEDPDPLVAEVASAGLDEFPEMYLERLGTVPTLELTATDLDRSWTYGTGDVAARVSAPASDLYLRLMSRPGAKLPDAWARAVDAIPSVAG